ncbi:PREDICTED: protein KASH5 [Elephantulus edwardii]|uniref:protein KASH5 n=1 Tax=Elephantulus edwardii TaxID=28737 RepID=UPI0003F05ABD|nr:PREDICTED: protein KASH5 [Elephantulus edwardii]
MDLPEDQKADPAAATYLWDQPEQGSLGTPLSLEEQVLNSTFEACDPKRTGVVAVTRVVAYLATVTGRGPQDACLQTLARSLDPSGEGPGATVDLDTFLAVMRDWIAACQLDGGLELEEETAFQGALTPQQLPSGCPEAEEPANLESFGGEDPRLEPPATADLLSSLEDLELSNRRLAQENSKLQRSVEMAEESTTRLSEEMVTLRKQLRSAQQALQFAKAVDEDLEDLKTLAKSLEEKNRNLLTQARQTEKEQQHLVAKMETLQEENGKLQAERDGVKKRSEELALEKEALKRQIYECECLICQRDTMLSERTHHAESLARTLEEYKVTTQELRLEISHLEEQLSQTHRGPDELLEGTQERRVGCTKLLPPSLGLEIQATQQKQNKAAAEELLSPLCGVWQWEEVLSEPEEEAAFPPEASPGTQRNFQEEPVQLQEEQNEHVPWLLAAAANEAACIASNWTPLGRVGLGGPGAQSCDPSLRHQGLARSDGDSGRRWRQGGPPGFWEMGQPGRQEEEGELAAAEAKCPVPVGSHPDLSHPRSSPPSPSQADVASPLTSPLPSAEQRKIIWSRDNKVLAAANEHGAGGLGASGRPPCSRGTPATRTHRTASAWPGPSAAPRLHQCTCAHTPAQARDSLLSPAKPELEPDPDLQRALVPVTVAKELVWVRRRPVAPLGLPSPEAQQFRVTRPPLDPRPPVLGLLLLLLLSILLLRKSPPPTWPHLQLSYLQPPPV